MKSSGKMIINANSLHMPLQDNSVHCVITSPPYFQLRKYDGLPPVVFGGDDNCRHEFEISSYKRTSSDSKPGAIQRTNPGSLGRDCLIEYGICSKCGAWRGHLGLEPNVKLFINHLVIIFREVKRILRPDGILVVNIGDKKNSVAGGYYPDPTFNRPSRSATRIRGMGKDNALAERNIFGIPWQFAFAMQKAGWILRQDIIWRKMSPMPSSVNAWRWQQHRIKTDYNNRSGMTEWIDCPGCEKCKQNDGLILRYGCWRPTLAHEYIFLFSKSRRYYCDAEAVRQLRGANPHSVMVFPIEPLNEPHYAAFPGSLPEFFIRVGTSEKGCCAKCGAPWARVMKISGGAIGRAWNDHQYDMTRGNRANNDSKDGTYRRKTLAWKATCKCKDINAPIPCIVLDPFLGSGRTAEAAIRLGRKWIGLELSKDYCAMAKRRLSGAMGRNGKLIVLDEKRNKQGELFKFQER